MMPFEKGASGNKQGRIAGRTPGAKLRKAIEAKADEILQAVIDAAILGDMAACKMLLDRITPTLKPQALAINLPVKETLPEQGNEIIKATVTGQIPPDVGAGLITALAAQGRLIELQELGDRLDHLEKKLELQNAPK
ncbi:MAG: hypothetical protein WCP96_11455 [Methylococcaceae bacterium]